MKGINPLVSHTMTIIFSVLLIVVVITAMNSITEENKKFVAENEMSVVCNTLKTAIEELNLENNYVSASNYTSTSTVDLPKKIGGFNYRTSFSSNTLKIETISSPTVNQTCKIGFSLNYTGSTNGGKTRLDLTNKDDGSKDLAVSKT